MPLAEVEPVDSIVRRFSGGAMSHGALSAEAHETIAIAFNRLGGRSNSGEGGEDRERYRDERNSKIKQIASGLFGVTPEYCARHNWLVGSPRTVTDKLHAIYEEVGGFGTLLLFCFDYSENPQAWHHSMELLANEVMTKFKGLVPK